MNGLDHVIKNMGSAVPMVPIRSPHPNLQANTSLEFRFDFRI
jgi:hypothetical protein